MFEEYKKSLRDFYRIKKENHRLSINLGEPGREKIRNECVKVLLRKDTQKDKDFIKSVFDPSNEYEDQVRSIERFDLNKFRPLVSFLLTEKNIRDEMFVKLLAWLIDFPTYNQWREFSEEELKLIFDEAAEETEEETTGPDRPDTTNDTEDEEGETDQEDETTSMKSTDSFYIHRFSSPQIIITCILLFIIAGISFIAWERMPISVSPPKAGENAMYWDGNHYEPVKAGAQEPGVTIIPLDLNKLQRQRKITLPDTMTKYSLGKVWYKGRGKGHEFFTDSGIYPPDTSRRLLPLSSTILKYSSYDRYLLNRLIWFLCAAFVISIGGYLVSRMKRKKTVEKEVQTADDYVTNLPKGQFA